MPRARTDRHNNPAAFTTDVAAAGGLILGKDYTVGDPFTVGSDVYHTARLIGDPIEITIRLIDKIGYFTKTGIQRWTYMAIPRRLWDSFSPAQKKLAIEIHYQHEGGTELKNLFNG